MRGALVLFAASAVVIALIFLRPAVSAGPPMRDFEAYYAAGILYDGGADPYSTHIWQAEQHIPGISSKRFEALPFVGPPALLPLLGALARLPFATANIIWRALLISSLVALAPLTLVLAGVRITPLSCGAAVIAGLGFGPLTSTITLGQIALPAFVFSALALRWSAASLLGWMQPNVALSLAPLRMFLPSLAVFGSICLAIAGLPGIQRYAGVVRAHGAAERFSAIQITPESIAYGFGLSEPAALVTGIVVAIAAIVFWGWLVMTVRDAVARFCATCALLPFVLPFFHEHDLVVLFVPAVICALRVDARRWPLVMLGALLSATDWLNLAQRLETALQTLLLIAAFGAALVALRPDARARMLLVPGAVLVLIAVSAFIARLHPSPVWPDAMGLLPADIQRFDIAHAWHAELAATGLFVRDAVWSALRAASLLGCALLAYAVLDVNVHHVVERRDLIGMEVS